MLKVLYMMMLLPASLGISAVPSTNSSRMAKEYPVRRLTCAKCASDLLGSPVSNTQEVGSHQELVARNVGRIQRRMLNIVVSELNRMWEAFRKYTPDFKGKVS